ncbi:nitroreductase family deazaflavin-dependent oxidoreductase [Actinomadura sp. ATCC 31491]|uniref:Nitroreductase family deazaflavin-dependent oxidoreductase n=1 Tax=Actinomadura luzonensis TaxID=2805427 RepID=A0ABT0FY85_9ACTN|nr:nitroreductase/quinone reductase family protein [Actinomadura luzonensis]MCK2217314.1 nitroreductase family deazaflavin-dependent oxidoreductase [Actinomadura luzonensis]
MTLHQWLYRGGRPNRLARAVNRLWAAVHSSGLLMPGRLVTLEVTGRHTGRTVALPLVVARLGGRRYLVSMLGRDANWVANVRAARGLAVLRHGTREHVRLVELPPAERAPVLRRYLAVAPGARPHLPVDRWAPLADFDAIAGQYPVFRVEPAAGARPAVRP